VRVNPVPFTVKWLPPLVLPSFNCPTVAGNVGAQHQAVGIGQFVTLGRFASGKNDPNQRAPKDANLKFKGEGQSALWTWCDSLFMAPPVLARMSAVTRDPRYLRAMDVQWWRTYDRLWDPQEHLFFRDERFITMRSERGKKIIWSRGNGSPPRGYGEPPRATDAFRLFDLELVILDDRVAQEPVAGFVDAFAPGFLVAVGQLDFHVFAHAHRANAFVAHVFEGVLDGFALRVEHGFLWCYDNLGFHFKQLKTGAKGPEQDLRLFLEAIIRHCRPE